ncbi:single-stranded DNA-binding protein [Ligilactobacillus ceti]|uniref:Single-stranded DNA-binding protein n=1 Tax=Ligilactobacillus ceti DSM 22408 TaxID=1122146 RepID=A0A0R2KPC1_9LACO|nr:single-stranded DNA-binding protein [Ligilactobacillus ceti]KRN89317.1 single-strand dna binding protein [Ligilactobacillus ceti DSM 22408]
MINRATLVGRLTRDPDLRYTQSGIAVATFTLAVNRQFKNQNGEREADFINCVIWRKAAENFANFTHKGSLIGVDGRIQTRNYENQQGQRVYVTEVAVDSFSLLESRSEAERYRQSNPAGGATPNYQSDNNPYGAQMNSNAQSTGFTGNVSAGQNTEQTMGDNNAPDPFANSGQQIDISDDDLPF